MQLPVDGRRRTFVTLTDFREAYGLSDTFEVATFQPKDWHGLGSIDQAGAALAPLREQTVAAVPQRVPAAAWLHHLSDVVATFEAELRRANPQIGLHRDEVAFAVNGFSNMCTALAYALARARLTRNSPPTFDAVYRRWVYDSVTVGSETYDYTHEGETWAVRVITHIYGRVGLAVETPDGVHYVADKALACPAEGFMQALLRDVGEAMIAASV